MNKTLNKILRLGAMTFVLLIANSGHALAGVHLTGSGSWSNNHLGLETHTSQMFKGAIAVDLGAYLRLGYSYSEAVQHREGYLAEADSEDADPTYIYFEQDINQFTHSVDLFAVLYAGQIFTPYIFGGIGLRTYKIVLDREDKARSTTSGGPIPFPNFGCGLGIKLNEKFSLKFSNTWSIGQSQDLEGNTKLVRDTQLDAGITFSL